MKALVHLLTSFERNFSVRTAEVIIVVSFFVTFFLPWWFVYVWLFASSAACTIYICEIFKKAHDSILQTHKDSMLSMSSHLSCVTLPNHVHLEVEPLLFVWWDFHFKHGIIQGKLLPKLSLLLPKVPQGDKLSISKFDIGKSRPRVIQAVAHRNEAWKNSVFVDITVLYEPEDLNISLLFNRAWKLGITNLMFSGVVRLELIFPQEEGCDDCKCQDSTSVAMSFLDGYQFGFQLVVGDNISVPSVISYAAFQGIIRHEIGKNMLWPLQLRLSGPGTNVNTKAPRPRPFKYLTGMSILCTSICDCPPESMELMDKTWGNSAALLDLIGTSSLANGVIPDLRGEFGYLCLQRNTSGHPISCIRVVGYQEKAEQGETNFSHYDTVELCESLSGVPTAGVSLGHMGEKRYIQYVVGDPQKGPWITDAKLVLGSELALLKRHLSQLSDTERQSGCFPCGYKDVPLCSMNSPSLTNGKDTVYLMFRQVSSNSLKNGQLSKSSNVTMRKTHPTSVPRSFGILSRKSQPTSQPSSDPTVTLEIIDYVTTLCTNAQTFTKFPVSAYDLQCFTRSVTEKHKHHMGEILKKSKSLAETRLKLVPANIRYSPIFLQVQFQSRITSLTNSSYILFHPPPPTSEDVFWYVYFALIKNKQRGDPFVD